MSIKRDLLFFEAISYSKCHISSFTTKLGFEISPFSDFLLHDMGEDLADGRVEFETNEKEWRTAPLWGISLHEKITKTDLDCFMMEELEILKKLFYGMVERQNKSQNIYEFR